MYLLVSSKGKILESGTLEKCADKLAKMRNDAANPEYKYQIDDLPSGFTVHYHTFLPITYHIVKLGE